MLAGGCSSSLAERRRDPRVLDAEAARRELDLLALLGVPPLLGVLPLLWVLLERLSLLPRPLPLGIC